MENVVLMEHAQPSNRLNEDAPNVFFLEPGGLLRVAGDLLKQVPVVAVLHYNTKACEFKAKLTIAIEKSHQ